MSSELYFKRFDLTSVDPIHEFMYIEEVDFFCFYFSVIADDSNLVHNVKFLNGWYYDLLVEVVEK